MVTHKLKYLSLSVVWILNPVYLGGCGTQSNEFTFGEAEMLELVDSINSQTWTIAHEDGDFELEIALSQSMDEIVKSHSLDMLSAAHACGERVFFAEASACLESTILPLEGVIRITDYDTQTIIYEELLVDGNMYVYGYELTNAEIALSNENTYIQFYSGDGLGFSLDYLELDE